MKSKKSPTSKATLLLLVAVVVLLWNGTRRQRRLLRAIAGFSFVYWGEDQVNGVVGFFSNVGSDIKDFVLTVLRAALDAVTNLGENLYDLVHGAVGLAIQLFSDAKDFATGLMWSVLGYVNTVVQGAKDFASWIVAAALNAAESFASWIVTEAYNALLAIVNVAVWGLTVAVNAAKDFATWIVAQAYNALLAIVNVAVWGLTVAVNAAKDFATWIVTQAYNALLAIVNVAVWGLTVAVNAAKDFVVALVSALHDALFAALDFVKSEMLSRIADLERAVFGEIQAIFGVITAVVDWLIALAEFPFTTARDMWAAMRSTGGKTVLAHAPDFVDRWGDHVLTVVVGNVNATNKPYTLAPLPRPPATGGGTGAGGATFDYLVQLAAGAGVTGHAGRIAAAIALAESGGDPTAHNTVPPDDSWGYWQINANVADPAQRLADIGISTWSQLFDPATNAHAMAVISRGGTVWGDWSTFNDGTYLHYLPAA